MRLTLNVHKASGIRAADFDFSRNPKQEGKSGSSDPFVRAFFERHEILTKQDSSVKEKTLEPTWEESLLIRVPSGRGYGSTIDESDESPLPTLVVRVYDKDVVGYDDFLGEVKIPPSVWAVERSEARSTYKLGVREDEDGRVDSNPAQAITGDIELSFETTQISIEDRGWIPVEYLGADRTFPLACFVSTFSCSGQSLTHPVD